ncbi:MAG TPA: DUF1963 domain-containing protein, partial [Conexibacter sp.]|nr:DUF1963 domain-containing protein [Conexibacter sp.]
ELLALADELGLGARRAAIDALARRSLRLLPGDPEAAPRAGGSRLGGAPDLPHDAPWPHWRERPLEHRLQLDLAEVAAALGDEPSPLPAHGTLWCFTPLQPPSGLRAQHAGACAVLLGEAPADAEPGYGDAVALAPELVLPRAWSAPVEALALEGEEQLAWQALREHLADVQGVALGDAGRDDDAPQSLHRLLGYPDERHGDMPLACELLDAGAEPGDEPPLAHPRAAELEPRAGRWQLLLQLSHDERVGWSWGDRRARLYAWADERALAAGELAGVRAFVQ